MKTAIFNETDAHQFEFSDAIEQLARGKDNRSQVEIVMGFSFTWIGSWLVQGKIVIAFLLWPMTKAKFCQSLL